MQPRHLSEVREAAFPRLRKENYHITSPEDGAYNCIAWAAGKTNTPWWPEEEESEGVHWPEGVERKRTVEAFIAAYRTEGYTPCDGADRVEGFEKIAIYVDDDGLPTHAARQLEDGTWTSKLGTLWEDINHKTLEDLEGCGNPNLGYGKSIRYMERRKLSDASKPVPEPKQDTESK